MGWLSRTWQHYTRLGHARQIVRALNALMDSHPDVARDILALAETRILCTPTTADHPTIQVVNIDGAALLGLIGMLNGIVGARPDGLGYVVLGSFEDGSKRFVAMGSAIPGCASVPALWRAIRRASESGTGAAK